jgi:hypothetical protein
VNVCGVGRGRLREGARPGKRSEQQSLASSGARSPLPAPRSLAADCSRSAALGVGPAEGWALGRVGVGRGGAGCELQGRWRRPRAILSSRSWPELCHPQQLPRRRCRPRSGKSPSAMLTVRRERPLGLGVCVSVCERVCWPSRPSAATARLGLSARRLACSPSATAARLAPALGRALGSGASPPRPKSSVAVRPGAQLCLTLPLGAQAPSAAARRDPNASPLPGSLLFLLPLPPPALPPSLPTAASPPPSGAALERQPPARPPPPPPPALASLRSPVSAHPPLRRLRGGVSGGGDSPGKVRPTFPGPHGFPAGCIGASPHLNPKPPGWRVVSSYPPPNSTALCPLRPSSGRVSIHAQPGLTS